jgi:hypothetical protein
MTDIKIEGIVTCSSIRTPAIASGDSAIVSCTIAEPRKGEFRVQGCADAAGTVAEEAEGNNCCLPEILVVRDPDTAPDLTSDSLGFQPPRPTRDEADTVKIAIRNAGNATASETITELKVDGFAVCAAIPTPVLPAGAETVAVCILPPQPTGQHAVEACVDAGGFLPEGQEDNNCLSATLWVDLGARPPVLIPPPLPQTFTFAEAPDSALLAQDEVNHRIADAGETAASGNFLSPLNGTAWTEGEAPCWNASVGVSGCGYFYETCRSGPDFLYTLVQRGFCGGSLQDSWMSMRAVSDVYGLNGECRFFTPQDSVNADNSYVWSMANAYSGEWRFYRGEAGTAPEAVLNWSGPPAGTTEIEWTVPEVTRWLLRATADQGTMNVFGGSGLDSLRQEITWGGGHGSWTIYRDGGSTRFLW